MSVFSDVFEDVQEGVGVLRVLGMELGGLQDRGGHPGIAQDGQQGVAVDHVVVLRVPNFNAKKFPLR